MRIADLSIETGAGIVRASIAGEIDMSNVQELRMELTRAATNRDLGLVLDLTAIEYLDSAGIQLVHRLREDLRSRGQELALVITADSVINDTLRLAGLEWNDNRYESVEAAMQAILKQGPSSFTT
jgi:anti-anti-sigma factor